jgi:mono/diheme cytochrome c family protein
MGNASLAAPGATVDVSQLPPASSAPVDYARDIQPLLQRSCLRCHGPEKPKSNFRLDSREAVLIGGSIGVNVVVSNSAASSLIHYVARLKDVDEDLWMPPQGKAPTLSREEVALVRAWVDQGLPWSTSAPPARLALELAPTVGWTTVSGNERVFREHHWMPEGWNGGVERFDLQERLDKRTQVTAEGRALRDDYRLTLQLERHDLGFLRGGFEQFRKYYSDSGGYFEGSTPPIYSLDRDLHLDLGRLWADVGLTLPHWPRLTLGYEHQYKDGEKSLTSWSPVTQAGVTRNLFPTSKHVDEETHILKFNLDHEIRGLRIEDDFRAEWSQLRTSRTNAVQNPPGSGTLFLDQVQEAQDSFHAANALRLERQFTPWLFTSGGYLYSHFDADASFSLDEAYLSGSPGFARRWRSPGIVLERKAHVGNLNGQFGPWDGFTAALGVQSEWSQQRGFGDASFDFELPGGGYSLRPTTQQSAIDRATVTEHVGLRYAKIPKTVLFAEGRLRQESLDQFEDQPDGNYPLRRDTDATSDVRDFRGGFNTSPWRPMSFSASYRWLEKRTRYDHRMDLVPSAFGDFPGDGYSAFIRERDTCTDEVEARLAYHWSARLKTTFSYRLVSSDYRTSTDPVTGFDPITFDPIPGGITPGTSLLSGNYDAHIYSLNVVSRPLKRLSLNTTFSFQDTRTSTANDSPSIAPYQGHIYSVLASGNYAWNAKTDLRLSYAFAHADFDQGQPRDGLPLGLVYGQHGLLAGLRHRFSERLSASLRYGFFLYGEPSSAGFNDYTAHSFFATVSFRFP